MSCNNGGSSKGRHTIYVSPFLIPSEDLSLLALLNSSVAWYFFVGTTTVFRGGYFRMKQMESLHVASLADTYVLNGHAF